MSKTYYIWWMISPVFFFIGIYYYPELDITAVSFLFCIATFYVGYCRYNEYERYTELEQLKAAALAKQLHEQGEVNCPYLDHAERSGGSSK